jgi:hypothetical protein
MATVSQHDLLTQCDSLKDLLSHPARETTGTEITNACFAYMQVAFGLNVAVSMEDAYKHTRIRLMHNNTRLVTQAVPVESATVAVAVDTAAYGKASKRGKYSAKYKNRSLHSIDKESNNFASRYVIYRDNPTVTSFLANVPTPVTSDWTSIKHIYRAYKSAHKLKTNEILSDDDAYTAVRVKNMNKYEPRSQKLVARAKIFSDFSTIDDFWKSGKADSEAWREVSSQIKAYEKRYTTDNREQIATTEEVYQYLRKVTMGEQRCLAVGAQVVAQQ